MVLQLQKFSHKLSAYLRPNQTWVCGKIAQGYRCEAGPDKHGFCRTEFECKPYLQNQRWFCSRSSLHGGNCTDGPLPDGRCCRKVIPCQPQRSLIEKRRLFVKWSLLFVFAVLLFFLSSPFKQTFFNPGDLSFKHASIEKCSDCHQIFERHFFSWIKQAWSGDSVMDNSTNCLDCHKFGDDANNAHGLDADSLEQRINKSSQRLDDSEKQLACINCHLEHHGLSFDLTAVAPQNCAYCHQLDRSLFKAQHPQFDQYPYQQNSRLIFDHTTHADKYYFNRAGTKRLDTAPESCQSCHQMDFNGAKMLWGDYQRDCKRCHNDMFEQAESFVLLELPGLDSELVDSAIKWPEEASGSLTGFMVMLLATEPLFVNAMEAVEDFYDLSELDQQKTLMLMVAIQKLFDEIYNKGPIVFKQRLASAFACQLKQQEMTEPRPGCTKINAQLDSLMDLIPMQLFCTAAKQWFSEKSVNDKETTGTVYAKAYCQTMQKSRDYPDLGLWALDSFALEYKPVAHKDPFLHVLFNLVGQKIYPGFVDKIRQDMFAELNSEDASVQCTKCHSVVSADGEHFTVKWPNAVSPVAQKQFIKFKHDVHIKYQQESVCVDCHQENKSADYLAGYHDFDPLTFNSNFKTNRETCLSCHQSSMTETQCQLCHNYHIVDTAQVLAK